MPQKIQLYEIGSIPGVLVFTQRKESFWYKGLLQISNPKIMLLMDGTARIVATRIEGNIFQEEYYFDIDAVPGVRQQLTDAPDKPTSRLII